MKPLSRDRKYLWVLITCALASQAMLFTVLYAQQNRPSAAAAIATASDCEAQLARLYARHGAGRGI
jgi:hypothetical protein